jgi:hypothetical protein
VDYQPAATFGLAWALATIALGLHVADEATHDFLSWYNPRALRIRRVIGIPFFPPTFTFVPWLAGLAVAVLLLASATPAAFNGSRALLPLAFFLAAIHIANGIMHITASILARKAVPGVWSAPLLLVTGIWLGLAAIELA